MAGRKKSFRNKVKEIQSTENGMTEYEQQREQNIKRNMKRMKDVGLDLKEDSVPTPSTTAKRKRQATVTASESSRRSSRPRPAVAYNEERVEKLGSEDFFEQGRAYGRSKHLEALAAGRKLKNSGAGPPPPGGRAPFGGTRYMPLTNAADAPTHGRQQRSGGRRNNKGQLVFAEAEDFLPTLSPPEMIARGVFGGCYFNPRGGKKGIFGRDVAVDHKEYPEEWFEGVPSHMYINRRYDVRLNKYKVKAGQDQAFWESKGWIHEQDPRGWFQWYTRFYLGRRTEDDARQISRWKGVVGEKGRWKNALCNKIIAQNKSFDDPSVSPVIRQTLLHWGYELTEADFLAFRKRTRQ